MQGKKTYQEKFFNSFQLSERIPTNNFYRRLKATLDLKYLYELTEGYYGKRGQKSIDPVVFFKFCLVGYLENLTSDRHLVGHCGMRMDILYFLGYDIGEELPWHSTIRRTRQLFPEPVFEQCFTHVFNMYLSAMAYNLKKYLKFTQKRAKSGAGMLAFIETARNTLYRLNNILFRQSIKRAIPTV